MSQKATKPPHGLPAELPQGEVLLWQGKPSWRSLAMRAFHVRKIAVYFAIILVWRIGQGLYSGESVERLAIGAAPLLLIALAAIVICALLAWIYCRTTTYTITNRRIFMRYGAALPMMLNLPFGVVGAAAAKVHRDGTADIPLTLIGSGRVAYLHLWPHARPWRLRHPEPMLRSIPDGARVASLLATALSATTPPAASQARKIVASETARDGRRAPADLTPAAA
jgi:hypothetical protein